MLLRTQIARYNSQLLFARSLSNTSATPVKRFIQTSNVATNETTYVPYSLNKQPAAVEAQESGEPAQTPQSSAWSKHSLPSARSFKDLVNKSKPSQEKEVQQPKEAAQPAETTAAEASPQKKKRVKRTLKPRKALITLSPSALSHLRGLLDQPTPQMIRIGVKNRGCSGLTYNLEYIEQPNKFDEVVEQDGIKVIIDSKALFSIVGSKMDWIDDKLSSRFVFKNPNSKGTCGCGESFMV